ncbi:MAG: hypothetical protein ACREPI_08145 [Candidatus Dormibacterales bacterium]
MDDLRVSGIRALADLGGAHLEVDGKIVIHQARRLSDFVNRPDAMLEVEEARIRFHGASGSGVWEEVEGVSLNRDRVVVLIPIGERDPGPAAGLRRERRSVRSKLFMAGLHVTGFLPVPVQDTVAAFLEQTGRRYIPVMEARITREGAGAWLDDLPPIHRFCLLSRSLVAASIETRAEPSA